MQRVVGQPGRVPVGGARIISQCAADLSDVLLVSPCGRRPGDQLLDQAPEIEDLGQLSPGRHQRSRNHAVGVRALAGQHKGAAAAASFGRDITRRLQSLQGLTDCRPADLEQAREFTFGGQTLIRHEFPKRDRGPDPLGDPFSRRAYGHRREQRAERLIRGLVGHGRDTSCSGTAGSPKPWFT